MRAPKNPVRRFVLALTVAAASAMTAAPAMAGGSDEFDLADALSRRGYSDLAREIFETLINDPKSPPARKAEGQYGLAILAHSDAKREAGQRVEKLRKPMDQVHKLFDEADQVFAKFIEQNGAHPRALEAKLSRAKLLQDKAEYTNICIASGWLPPTMSEADARKSVAGWFDTAIGLLEENRKKAESDEKKSDGDAKLEAQDRLAIVWLFKFSSILGKVQALPRGDAGAAKAVDDLNKEYEDFLWIYSGTIRELWATKMVGTANCAVGKMSDGIGYLRAVAALNPESPEDKAAIADVVFEAFEEIGRQAADTGRKDGVDWPKEALKDFDRMAKNWPKHMDSAGGQSAALQWARCLRAAGNADAALAKVQDVAKRGEGNINVKTAAAKALGEMIQGGGGATGAVDPKLFFQVGQQAQRDGDYRKAISAFQSVIAGCDTPEQMDEWGWKAWDRISDCYFAQDRFYEAFLALDAIEQAWRKEKTRTALNDMTKESGYKRAFTLDRLFRKTKDKADETEAKRAMDEFERDHPDSDRLAGAAERNADTTYRDAIALRPKDSQGDEGVYRAALEAAIPKLANIDKTSKQWDVFQSRIADCLNRLGRTAEAVKMADDWLAAPKAATTDRAVERSRATANAQFLTLSIDGRIAAAVAAEKKGDAAAAVAGFESALATLAKNEKEIREAVNAADRLIDTWRTECLIGTGQVDKADELVDGIIKAAPDAPNSKYLAAKIGAALDRAARVYKAKEAMREFQQYMLRAAKRREWVLERTTPRNPDSLRSLGGDFADGGDYVKAESYLKEAKSMYEARASAHPAGSKEQKEELNKARSCTVDLIDLLVQQQKYDAAIPQLEEELVRDAKARAAVLARLRKDTNLTKKELKDDLIPKIDGTRNVFDKLTGAYMRAPSKERLIAAVNLIQIGLDTTPNDVKHTAPHIELTLRHAEAYLGLFNFTKSPEDGKWARAIARNLEVTGALPAYERELPGAKARWEKIVRDCDRQGIK
ncbi:MAG: hypothetical protein HMLKMBBP_00676 [Planctomycetes bacterium]|nr:hypothetical protein [Planctomycetota bacterium]